jgi:hypothetical protein
MLADIPQPRGAKQGVDYGMGQYVSIAIAGETFIKRNLNSTQNQLASRCQLMYVISNSDPHKSTSS